MDGFDATYAPQSPDLSEYQNFDQPDASEPLVEPYQTLPQIQPHGYGQPVFYPQNAQYQSLQGPHQFSTFPPQGAAYPPQFPPQPDAQNTAPPAQQQQSHGRGRPPKDGPKSAAKSKKSKADDEVICDKPAPGILEGIDVKTKFPVARIKRIMQADEDVGKVSQVTPTAVSKALELFIISLTLKSASVARSKSSRRVTAAHLKQAVQGDEQMDFLEQIVSKVPDVAASSKDGKKKGGATTEGEEDEESSDDAYDERRSKKKGRKGDDD